MNCLIKCILHIAGYFEFLLSDFFLNLTFLNFPTIITTYFSRMIKIVFFGNNFSKYSNSFYFANLHKSSRCSLTICIPLSTRFDAVFCKSAVCVAHSVTTSLPCLDQHGKMNDKKSPVIYGILV